MFPSEHREREIGIPESEWRDDPEGIEDWIRWYQSLEPLEFTPEEEAEIAAWRQAIKQYTLDNMSKRVDGLFE